MQTSPKDKLHATQMPAGWKLIDELNENVDLFTAKIQIAGKAAQHELLGTSVTGSSASWTQNPEAFAYFELLERMAIVEALDRHKSNEGQVWRLIDPHRGGSRGEAVEIFQNSSKPDIWQPSKSNGVALGSSWQHASQNAVCEAVERHLVLASWYGALIPQKLEAGALPLALAPLARHYNVMHYSFGELPTAATRTPVAVTGTFFWPRKPNAPLIYGFGAGLSSNEALQKSLKEAVQRLSFLDGEEVPEIEPLFSPTPDYHQEYFLHPERQEVLSKWLRGEFFKGSESTQLLDTRNPVQFVDLTPSTLETLVVVKALTPSLLPLCFGRFIDERCPEIEADRLIHPVV